MACVWWLGRVLNFCVLGSLLSLSCLGNGLRIQLSDFALAGPSAAPAGWQPWAQREEVMPRCYIDTTQFRSKSSALAISGNSNAAEYGGWTYRLGHVQAGKFYRLTAYYRTQGVDYEQLRVVARLDWRDEADKRAGQPDYAYQLEPAGDWKKVTLQVPAPEQATLGPVRIAPGVVSAGNGMVGRYQLRRGASPQGPHCSNRQRCFATQKHGK